MVAHALILGPQTAPASALGAADARWKDLQTILRLVLGVDESEGGCRQAIAGLESPIAAAGALIYRIGRVWGSDGVKVGVIGGPVGRDFVPWASRLPRPCTAVAAHRRDGFYEAFEEGRHLIAAGDDLRCARVLLDGLSEGTAALLRDIPNTFKGDPGLNFRTFADEAGLGAAIRERDIARAAEKRARLTRELESGGALAWALACRPRRRGAAARAGRTNRSEVRLTALWLGSRGEVSLEVEREDRGAYIVAGGERFRVRGGEKSLMRLSGNVVDGLSLFRTLAKLTSREGARRIVRSLGGRARGQSIYSAPAHFP